MVEIKGRLFDRDDRGGGGISKRKREERARVANMGLRERARYYESTLPILVSEIRARHSSSRSGPAQSGDSLTVDAEKVHESARRGILPGRGNYTADLDVKDD
jgi:hypothetical protein